MSCTEGETRLGKDGWWSRCVNGSWMRMATGPVVIGPGVGTFVRIDSLADLQTAAIKDAIDDDGTQVVVAFVAKPDAD